MTSFGLHFIEDSKDPEKEGLWLLIMTAKGADWFKLDPNINPLVYVKQLEAIKKLLPISKIRTYKQYLGHTMAASGAIELAIDLYKQNFKYLLKNSFGLGGTNCSILIKKYKE